jgi:hypothetical protein
MFSVFVLWISDQKCCTRFSFLFSFSHLLQDMCCSFSNAFLIGVSVKIVVVLVILFTLWVLGPVLGRSRMPCRKEGFFSPLWSRCWWSWRINRCLWGFTVTVGSFCSHNRLAESTPRP